MTGKYPCWQISDHRLNLAIWPHNCEGTDVAAAGRRAALRTLTHCYAGGALLATLLRPCYQVTLVS